LEERLEVLTRAGLLSAIAPVFEMGDSFSIDIPDEQTALLVRYMVARWGAEPVAWLLPIRENDEGRSVARWKRVGHAVFAETSHAPVVVCAGKDEKSFDLLRDEEWVDAFANTTFMDAADTGLREAFSGALLKEWSRQPSRPMISCLPVEDTLLGQGPRRIGADEVRHAMYWSLLINVPAGVNYSAQGTMNWEDAFIEKDRVANLPALTGWKRALQLAGARQLRRFEEFAYSIEFWRLRPEPTYVGDQPGRQWPARFIASAGTREKDLGLAYVPEDRTVHIVSSALPSFPIVGWFNPRTGETNAAVAVVTEQTVQFPTPDPGDWVLVMRSGVQR
jgi:hypothetical protein